MSAIYLTGTRNTGKALPAFLPDYIDLLLEQGHDLITTNKRGVDEFIIAHCDQHRLPLQVYEFLSNRRDHPRSVHTKSDTVKVLRYYAPTWHRFRHVAAASDRIVFFHSGRTRGIVHGMSTIDAFATVCRRRGINGQQLIVQNQETRWVSVTELRNSPIINTAHLYLYIRRTHDVNRNRVHAGHYRIETWRQIKGVVQPGVGRREVIIPIGFAASAQKQLLHYALQDFGKTLPERLIIHHHSPPLPETKLDLDIPYLHWKQETRDRLRRQIGAHIRRQQSLWYHRKPDRAARGLYR